MAFWSATESKLKMVVLFANDTPNQCWYSPIKHNNFNDELIIQKMINRLKPKLQGYTKIQIYDNATKTLKYVIE